MSTKLDNLLASIDPASSVQETSARIDQAMNAFHCPSVIDNWNDFKQCVSRFLCELEASALGLRQSMSNHLDHYWDQAFNSMRKVYGPNGEKAAFDIARTGQEGGLYAVLKAIARRSSGQYSQNEINSRVYTYWQDLSVEEQLDASLEYIKKYGHLLPSELTEGSGVRIRANLPQFLAKHPQMLQRTRRASY